MSEVTKDQKRVAYIWNWMCKNDVPDEVKRAFKLLVREHIYHTTEVNLKHWQVSGENATENN